MCSFHLSIASLNICLQLSLSYFDQNVFRKLIPAKCTKAAVPDIHFLSLFSTRYNLRLHTFHGASEIQFSISLMTECGLIRALKCDLKHTKRLRYVDNSYTRRMSQLSIQRRLLTRLFIFSLHSIRSIIFSPAPT